MRLVTFAPCSGVRSGRWPLFTLPAHTQKFRTIHCILSIMKFLPGPALFLILCILTCGCTQPPATPSPETSPSATLQTAPIIMAPTTSAPGSAVAVLSGSQPNTTLALNPGVIILSFKTESAQTVSFNFDLFSRNGYGAGGIFYTKGPFFNGSIPLPVPKTDVYMLNISCPGRWTTVVTLLDVENPLKVPVNLSGYGTTVTPVFYLEKGEYIFERNETGVFSPQYSLQYANGSYLHDVNNTYVQPGFGFSEAPFRFITIPESGIYFLSTMDQQNPNIWNVSIVPVPPLPHMGPGPMITQWTGTPSPS